MSYPDSILHTVIKPARYTGGEWNSIIKDWETAEVRFVLAYPDLYEIGMSNLALPILYDLLNRQPGVLCERVYAPWVDMEQALRQASIPLLSLESKHPLSQFDIIGFSLGYELTYTNVLNMLDLAGIPVLAEERKDSHPLIIAGGSCVLNPEPMSDFIDLFVIGEGEEVILELIEAFRKRSREGGSKEDLLRHLATIPGIYVPKFYQVDYYPDGRVSSITPTVPQAKSSIKRRIVAELPPPVVNPVVPYVEAIHDRGAVEIQRGCTRGCRFCQAGVIYRPQRYRPHDEVVKAVGELLRNCGYSEVSLLSLTTSEYPGIDKLVDTLLKYYHSFPLTISLPSLRMDSFSVQLMDSLQGGKKPGLTFAPEAGSERLRRVINKVVPEDDMLKTVSLALDRGWKGFKLYFMVGLPTETAEDVEGIVNLVDKMLRLKKVRPRINISVATFVPKPHTPFQWVAQEGEDELNFKHQVLRQGLRRKGVRLSWQDPKTSLIEAVLSRGDRRLGKVIHRAWQLGCRFDAWSDCFSYENWLKAFDEVGLDLNFYAYRHRDLDEVLSWGHIDTGVSPSFLKREYHRAFEGEETPNCNQGWCQACGLEKWQLGCERKY